MASMGNARAELLGRLIPALGNAELEFFTRTLVGHRVSENYSLAPLASYAMGKEVSTSTALAG